MITTQQLWIHKATREPTRLYTIRLPSLVPRPVRAALRAVVALAIQATHAYMFMREREVTCGTSHRSQNSMNHYQIKLQISKHWPVNWVSIGATDLLYVLCLNIGVWGLCMRIISIIIGGPKRPGTASCSQSYFNSTRISPYKQVMHAVQQGCKLQCDTRVPQHLLIPTRYQTAIRVAPFQRVMHAWLYTVAPSATAHPHNKPWGRLKDHSSRYTATRQQRVQCQNRTVITITMEISTQPSLTNNTWCAYVSWHNPILTTISSGCMWRLCTEPSR